MDKPISVGDLVVVVKPKPCCGKGKPALGFVFRVLEIRKSKGLHCSGCGKQDAEQSLIAVSGEKHGKNQMVYEIYRLKRIPPLDELEGEKTQENLRVPA